MKILKITAVLLILCLAFSFLASCDEETPDDAVKFVTVTLDYNDGRPLHTVKVESGKKMARPIDPEREGYTFGGWKTNGKEWDFEEHAFVTDITLTATWINASSLFDYTLNGDGTMTLINYTGSILSVSIPETISGNTVIALGDGIFKDLGTRMMTDLSIPSTVTNIGAHAFEGVTAKNVNIQGELSFIGESAFSGCKGLTSVNLAEGLTLIPYDAFSLTALETLDIPESVEVIDENAFYGCSSLKTIVIPRDVEIRNGAFSGCDALVTVFFLGSEEEWQNVLSKLDNGGGENETILSARILFYSETEPQADGNFWHRNKDGEPRGW